MVKWRTFELAGLETVEDRWVHATWTCNTLKTSTLHSTDKKPIKLENWNTQKQLHWLPVRQRITFKVATLMHSVFHQNCPPYLRDLIQFVNNDPTKRRLRSATTRTAATVRARTKLGDRAFSATAPSTWNSLTLIQFRKQLKTYLFEQAFNS